MTQPKIIIDSLGHKSDHEGESTVSDSDKNGELNDSDYMDNSKMTIFGYCIKFMHIIKGVNESFLTRLWSSRIDKFATVINEPYSLFICTSYYILCSVQAWFACFHNIYRLQMMLGV